MDTTHLLRGRRIGLALGGGAARGCAHLGVIEALEEAGVRPDVVAGTSMGAVVGAFYAADRLEELRRTIRDMDWRQVLRFFGVTFPRSGLVDGKRIADYVRERIGHRRIEELAVPFAAVAVDLADGAEVIMREGDLVSAIRASISVPGIFTPVQRGGRLLGDGGLVDPVPVKAARDLGADVVIAVDLNHDIAETKGVNRKGWFGIERNAGDGEGDRDLGRAGLRERLNQWWDTLRADKNAGAPARRLPNIFEVIMAAVVIMTKRITDARLMVDAPDVIIRPKLGHINFFEFNRSEEAIREGHRAACQALHRAGILD
ncbi:MAG: patatin [Kiritimatiellaeota bacterium]|nr:patatin [Kiritimatiellota bacterium]